MTASLQDYPFEEAGAKPRCFCGRAVIKSWMGCHGTYTCEEHGLVEIIYARDPCVHSRSLEEGLRTGVVPAG